MMANVEQMGNGPVERGLQETITGGTTSGGGATVPPTKVLYVDNNRVDAFTPDGGLLTPFKHIMDAVNQIVANGDGLTASYVVFVNPGNYPEIVTIENVNIGKVNFISYGFAFLDTNRSNTVVSIDGIKSTVNNNAAIITFQNFFVDTSVNTLHIDGGGVSANFSFVSCFISGGSATWANAAVVFMAQCESFCDITVGPGTVTVDCFNCSIDGTVALGGSSSFWQSEMGTEHSGNVTVAGGSNEFDLISGSRFAGSPTLLVQSGGIFLGRNCLFGASATVTFAAGSTATLEQVHFASGTFSGTAVVDGLTAIGSAVLGVAAPTVGAGQVGLGSTTAATATAGAATLPANPVGFLVINVAGTARKIPFYAT